MLKIESLNNRCLPYKSIYYKWMLFFVLVFSINNLVAQNPFITDQFTADPTARVFGDRVYVYPSHDVLCNENRGKIGWFCMGDYHVFSSENLTDWTDHGVIVSQDKVDWVDSTSYSMWAPDCIKKGDKYYFYFPSREKSKQGNGEAYFTVGVAISDNPFGPFTPESEPIKNISGIDPNPFIDKDGQAYLYWSRGKIFVAKLKENMLELATEPMVIPNLPEKGHKEGPFMFERNGLYYLTYPHVENKTERLEYAIGDNPMGPFKVAGVIMDESPSGCWTNHQSIVEFKDQWYLFYHDNDLSPKFDKNRAIRVDSLSFNKDGTIKKVIPTLRGVGLTAASKKIQLDRYSKLSKEGTSIKFLDSLNTFNGWKTILSKDKSWIQYNSVDFSKKQYTKVKIKAIAANGGVLQLRLNNSNGPIISEVNLSKNSNWNTISTQVKGLKPEIKNLVLMLKGNKPVEVDWISFE